MGVCASTRTLLSSCSSRPRAEVVAPQAGLRLEHQRLGQSVVDVALFAVDESRQPLIGAGVHAPAIEMEVIAGLGRAGVSAIEADHMEILVLDPDAAQEASLAGMGLRSDIEHQAADFTQKFAANVVELVVLLTETIVIDIDHLQEAARQELHLERENVPQTAEHLCA